MSIQRIVCPHCDTPNSVATCCACGRRFVITAAHLAGEDREFTSEPVADVPASCSIGVCDFCAWDGRKNPVAQVNAGLRQATCPVCHTEFLSSIEPEPDVTQQT